MGRILLVVTSVAIQCVIGLFLGHQFDMSVFFVAGYLVSHGSSPYTYFDATRVFSSPGFYSLVPGIGYPPPWPLFLGLVYTLVFKPTGNMFAYNLAIKLPSIASNIALAFVVEKTALRIGLTRQHATKIFYFLLFNPFMIYISAAWGQFDSVVILTTIVSMTDLYEHRLKRSAILLALSAALKIIPLALAPLFILFIKRNLGLKQNLEFLLTGSIALATFTVAPFGVFGWDIGVILNTASSRFTNAGGFTPFNILDFAYHTINLPSDFAFVGYIWIPALVLGYYALTKTTLKTELDLTRWTMTALFILLLTRSWVSEQNALLLIPLIALQGSLVGKNWTFRHLMWIVPLIYTVLNLSTFQMFLLVYPDFIHPIIAVVQQFESPRHLLMFFAAVAWQALGWFYVRRAIDRHERSNRTMLLYSYIAQPA